MHCLISPSGRPNNFYADDRFRETIIKLCKEKVRPSSNDKSDQFLRDVIAPNVLSLWKIKQVMAQATESTSHGDRHSVVSSTSDLSLIVKLLVEDAVFEYHPGRGTNGTEFIDLYIRGSRVIAAGGPLDAYQRRAQGNWRLRSVLDDGVLGAEGGESSDIDALEGEDVFRIHRETYEDNVNE